MDGTAIDLGARLRESAMSSGAFALHIDQAAGGGPNAPIRRVVPLPQSGGTINFSQVRVSLNIDNFDTDPDMSDLAIVRIRIFNEHGARFDQAQEVGVRTVINEIQPGDLLVSFEVVPDPTPGAIRPVVTALVEYSD